MTATVVTALNRDRHRETVAHMHADRKRVFVDRLKWRLPVVDGQFEMDEYDTEEAIYLIVTDPDTGGHLGSVRLLQTSKPHLLGDKFGFLCADGAPAADDVYEITRLCTTPEAPGSMAHQLRLQLMVALCEFAAEAGIARYTMMTHMAYLPTLLAGGWDIEPLGLPTMVGGEQLAAMQVTLHDDTVAKLRDLHGFRKPLLRLDGMGSAAAA